MVIRYRYTEWDGTQEIPPLDAGRRPQRADRRPDELRRPAARAAQPDAARHAQPAGRPHAGPARPAAAAPPAAPPAPRPVQPLVGLRRHPDSSSRRSSTWSGRRSTTASSDARLSSGDQRSRAAARRDDAPRTATSRRRRRRRAGLERRRRAACEAGAGPDAALGVSKARREQQAASAASRASAASEVSSSAGQCQQGGQQGGQVRRAEPGCRQSDEQQFAEMLKNIAERKQQLPRRPAARTSAGQMKELQNYEFMNPEAQARVPGAHARCCKQAMMETFFKDLQNRSSNMSPEDMQRMKDMVRDLNQMLQEKMHGQRAGLRRLHAAVRRPLRRQPAAVARRAGRADAAPDARRCRTCWTRCRPTCASSCRTCSSDKTRRPRAAATSWRELAREPRVPLPAARPAQPVPLPRRRGDRPAAEAMHLMGEMQDIDELERQLERTQYGGDIDDIDVEKLRELLGDEAAETPRPAEAVPRDPRGGRLHPQATATTTS